WLHLEPPGTSSLRPLEWTRSGHCPRKQGGKQEKTQGSLSHGAVPPARHFGARNQHKPVTLRIALCIGKRGAQPPSAVANQPAPRCPSASFNARSILAMVGTLGLFLPCSMRL